MRKRVKIALAVLLVAGLGVVTWQMRRPEEPEPVYQGKPLSVWLQEYYWDRYPVYDRYTIGSPLGQARTPTSLAAVPGRGRNLVPQGVVGSTPVTHLKFSVSPAGQKLSAEKLTF